MGKRVTRQERFGGAKKQCPSSGLDMSVASVAALPSVPSGS